MTHQDHLDHKCLMHMPSEHMIIIQQRRRDVAGQQSNHALLIKNTCHAYRANTFWSKAVTAWDAERLMPPTAKQLFTFSSRARLWLALGRYRDPAGTISSVTSTRQAKRGLVCTSNTSSAHHLKSLKYGRHVSRGLRLNTAAQGEGRRYSYSIGFAIPWTHIYHLQSAERMWIL